MLVHSVFFWLKKDLTEEQRNFFKTELYKLQRVSSAKSVYIGSPSVTDRPVVERSYDFALTVLFEGLPEHDKYQIDPAHKSFLEGCKPLWEKVLIYDAD